MFGRFVNGVERSSAALLHGWLAPKRDVCLDGRMRLAALRDYALSLPQTTWVSQWGGLVYKVAGKVFLVLSLDGEILDGVVFKCTPDEFDELTDHDGIVQAPYFAKRHWVRVEDLGALSGSEFEKRIRRSYDLVVSNLPKKTQASIVGHVADAAPAKTVRKKPRKARTKK